MGCPHEKQTDACPGVTIVIDLQDGHAIWTTPGVGGAADGVGGMTASEAE
jgi:hypothetical protein